MKLVLNKKISVVLLALLAVTIALVLFILFSKKIGQNNQQTKNFTTAPSYNEVVNDKTKSYIGKKVLWTGKIAFNLSQIDGVKLWIVDEQHTTTTVTDWFFAIPPDEPTAEETNGEWVAYMLKRFGSIDVSKVDMENDIFLVVGVLRGSDCTFNDNGQCVPNLEVEKIEKIVAK